MQSSDSTEEFQRAERHPRVAGVEKMEIERMVPIYRIWVTQQVETSASYICSLPTNRETTMRLFGRKGVNGVMCSWWFNGDSDRRGVEKPLFGNQESSNRIR